MEVPVYNMQGKEVGNMPIDEIALGETVNPQLIKQAYVRYHANRRQGSARTLNRGQVQGSTRKIYKQKGTGRARHGDKKPPQFRGGGHYKTKRQTREDFRQDMPKKMRRKANRNALLAKLLDSEVKIIDNLVFDAPKTRAFVDFIAGLKLDQSALVALSGDPSKSDNARRSSRNVDGVSTICVDHLNCFEMLNHRYLVIDRAELEGWLCGASSQTGKEAKINPMGAVAKSEEGA